MTASETGRSYWVTQIAVCGFGAVAAPALGIFLFVAEPDERGKGLLLILAGILFLGALGWVVRSYRRMSGAQRAVYAWAIAQQNGSMAGRGAASDAAMMSVASKASNGQLSRADLLRLESLRPGNPYPGTMPPPA